MPNPIQKNLDFIKIKVLLFCVNGNTPYIYLFFKK